MPGQPRPGGLPPPGQSGREEEEGPAEQAPEEPEKEPTLQPLPGFSNVKEKQVQFFQMTGYMRFRTEFWHQFNLGFNDVGQGTPFQVSADCYPPPSGTDPRAEGNPSTRSCDTNLSSANMRLRLEPTINVSDYVKVKSQIDLLDNLVLGSTPEGLILGAQGVPGATSAAPGPANVPIPGFNRTQVPPQAGRNSLTDSVQVKRAWAEVRTPFGLLSFGRMPSHWGMGMFINAGDCRYSEDCLDSDFGTNSDRVLFATQISGIRLAGIFDWAATGPTSDRLAFGLNQYQGEPFDVTNRDDVSQYGLVVGKLDTPEEWRDKVERFDTVWNLGAYLVYRTQDLDQTFNSPVPLGAQVSQVGQTLVKRDASATVIDIAGKLKWHHLLIEGEGALITGSIGGVKDFPGMNVSSLDVLQGGGLGRLTWDALHRAIKLKFESGFASGDQAESLLPGQTSYLTTPVVQPPNDHTITNFHFDPDYHVDLILFRHILGTVTNAIYVKPSFIWDPGGDEGAWHFQLDAVQSFAAVPVSTPGNSIPYGLEFDTSIVYRNFIEGFFAGFQYGVLFPMGALDEPTNGTATGLPSPLFSPGLALGSQSAAQTIRMFLAVKY